MMLQFESDRCEIATRELANIAFVKAGEWSVWVSSNPGFIHTFSSGVPKLSPKTKVLLDAIEATYY